MRRLRQRLATFSTLMESHRVSWSSKTKSSSGFSPHTVWKSSVIRWKQQSRRPRPSTKSDGSTVSFWFASCLPSILVWQLPSSVVLMRQIFADVSRRQTVSTFCRSHTVKTNCERWLRAIVPLKWRDPHHDHKVPVRFESCRELPSRTARADHFDHLAPRGPARLKNVGI